MAILSEAIAVAFGAHCGQVDKAGQPYIRHCMRVMERADGDEEVKIVAVLHDVLEDAAVTLADLDNVLTLSLEAKAALVCLKRNKDEGYTRYIKRIQSDPIATAVKIVDLEDNLDIKRLTRSLVADDVMRIEKYLWAWRELRRT